MRRLPNTKADRHHQIPKWYIRRFSFDGKRVHVFDRITKRFRIDVPENVAVERDLNTVTTTLGEKQRWAEGRLGELDGVIPELFDKLESGAELTREERWHVSFFIGFAETRGRGFRDELRASGEYQRIETELRADALSSGYASPDERRRVEEAFERINGFWMSAATIERLARDEIKGTLDGGGVDILAMAAEAQRRAQEAFANSWLVAEVPLGTSFLTSDRPVGPFKLTREEGRPSAFINVLPLSPRFGLFITNVVQKPIIVQETVDTIVVSRCNIAVAARCDRVLISSSESLVRSVAAEACLA